MPAVSVCDPVSAALRHSLDVGHTKSAEDITVSLASNASRILQTDINFEESANYQSKVLEHLKSKYMVLDLPNSDKQTENGKKTTSTEPQCNGPSLPKPKLILYDSNDIALGWRSPVPVGAGMYNVGNTCYLNSTLQALFHVPALCNWLLSDPHHNTKCKDMESGVECLNCAMAKTLQFSHEKSGNVIKPFYIFNKLKQICSSLQPGRQEDAHEFLRYLLEGMERAFLIRYRATNLDNYSKETTPVSQIFGGYLRSEVKCLNCGHTSTTFQHFQDLLVDIRKASTLTEALSTYFSRERIDSNDYKCEACKRRVPATKKFSLQRAPKVLCIQLKRFSLMGGKISKHVTFKPNIDIGSHLWRENGESPKKLNYRLVSIITHIGATVNCGHYTAVARASSGQYYSFDDSNVRQINLSNCLNTNAYIMIYEMESTIDKKLPIPQPVKPANIQSNGTNNVKAFNDGKRTDQTTCLKHSIPGYTPPPNVKSNKRKANDSLNVVKNSNSNGTQLPPQVQQQTVVPVKNGKSTTGSSLVPYGSSDDDDSSTASSSKNTTSNSCVNETAVSNNIPKASATQSKILFISKINTKNVKNEIFKPLSPLVNGSKSHGSPKYQNGKNELGNKISEGRDKWNTPMKVHTGLEERIPTKAASSINGWEVTKDTPSPTCGATPNGWSVTELKEECQKKPKEEQTLCSAAAQRSFQGTNRSEIVSHLLKMSHRGYGSSTVPNWNGNRSHLEREVDNERREERKRHHDPDDDDMDRGRVKKVKSHREYDSRSNPGYNPFQDYQNGKSWNRSSSNGSYHRRNYYNTSSHNRQRHNSNGNYNRQNQHYRYHSHSRDHWQRR